MRTVRMRVVPCLLVVILPLLVKWVRADETPSEAHQKAMFLFNLTKFVKWPEAQFSRPDAKLIVGVYADSKFAEAVEGVLAEKNLRGRGFEVRQLSGPEDGRNCHLVYFGAADAQKINHSQALAQRLPVLTVGESDGFLEAGGMLRLFFEGRRLRFEANLSTANRAGLKVSSKLLKLAKTVRHGGAE